MWWRASREGKREVEGFECTLALVWAGVVPWTMEWEGSGSGEERDRERERRGEREMEATMVRKGRRKSVLHVRLCQKNTKIRLVWA